MMFRLVFLSVIITSTAANSQPANPRDILIPVVAALQNCGPPQIYQWFGSILYQTVYQQTQGTGCYWQLQQLGPLTDLQLIEQKQFPLGPLYAFRGSHVGGSVDYYIGFGTFTNKIEHMTFYPTPPDMPLPEIDTPPTPDIERGGGGTEGTGGGEGCDLYPSMCQ